MSRADRRRAAGKQGPPRDISALRTAIAAARLPGSPADATDRARRILLAYVDAAGREGRDFAAIARDLASGRAALTVARVELDPIPANPDHACTSGCAFCCILPGDDGGLVTAAEARTLHAALAPLAGQPDGRAWHPRACAALDPGTRACRVYDARPVICRSYVSFDAAACEANADGAVAGGSGVLAPHVTYLLVHALCREALKGTAQVPTFSLARIAAAAADGQDAETALKSGRHKPRDLDAERRRSAAGYGAARR